MRIVQITPGAGGMFCGNCFRDNQLVAELRRMGHDVLMVPLYLPMRLDEDDQSAGIPVFFGGINVYLEQKLPLLGKMPDWLHRQLASPALLKWAAGKTAKTKAAELGALTYSMLKGEAGNQAREVDELISFLKQHHKPDLVCISNALLAGMVRKLKASLNCPVVCTLQGEDSFLDSLPERERALCWNLLSERSREIDLFIAPSKYFGDLMGRRLNLPAEKVRVVYNGLNLDGFTVASAPPNPPVLGYFARMCREKGLPQLVEAYILLKKSGKVPGLKLHAGGGMGPGDEPLVAEMKSRLQGAGVFGDVTFFPNVSKEQKQQFYQRLTVMSVPALYGEAFGLYLLEAWASGVPVVQPPVAAFPELIEASGAGLLAANESPAALAEAIESILLNPELRRQHSTSARKAAEETFSAAKMARNMVREYESLQLVSA